MLPHHHAAAAIAAAVPLRRRGWPVAAILGFFAGSILIDVDHYLSYVVETGDWSLRRAYEYHRAAYRKPRRGEFHPHWPPLGITKHRFLHGTPVLALVFLVAWRWPALRPVAWGMLFHRAQDEVWSWWD